MLEARGEVERFADLLSHRARPSEVVTWRRAMAASARLLARPGCDRRSVLREFAALGAESVGRTLRNRLHRYEPAPRAHAGTAATDPEGGLADIA
jgi:hypothetical protein